MIQLYYGNGKGKTTAAVGAALRYSQALGPQNVYFFQFLKDGSSSEVKGLSKLGIKTEADPFYSGFVSEIGEQEKQSYRKLLEKLEVQIKEYGLVVLDEVLDMYSLGVYTEEDISRLRKTAGDNNCELVFTGHVYKGVDVEPIVRLCDYVSYIKKEKHPFDRNIKPRIGIEY